MSKTMSWNLGAGPNRRSGGSIRPAKQAWAHSFLLPSKQRVGSSIPSRCLARHDGQKPRVLQESVNRCSAWQSGQRTRAALRSPHEPVTDHEGEARAGIAAIEVALDDLPDDRPKIPALILFAPEDCKACTPSRSASRMRLSDTIFLDSLLWALYSNLNSAAKVIIS